MITPSLASAPFKRLLRALKASNKTLSVVEQSCGGIIQASIMSQPGSSAVYFGGTIAYNTRRTKPILLNDDALHERISSKASAKTKDEYIQSKLDWTANVSVAYCEQMNTDYAIAEGGAVGPTFRPIGLTAGFSVVALAGRKEDGGPVEVICQEVIESTHADREGNMRLFADRAAEIATNTLMQHDPSLGLLFDDGCETEDTESHDLVLDRSTHLRSDEEALRKLAPTAKYLVLRANKILALSNQVEPAVFDHVKVQELLSDHSEFERTFLGILSDGTPYFGIDVLGDCDMSLVGQQDFQLVDTRTIAPLFTPIHNELALYATAMAQWQRRSSFCSLCGSPTKLIQAGTCRKCSGCDACSWPRQDPSIIVAVSSRDGQKLLLARSPRHPAKVHTVLAGFVEAGETMEAAVAREVLEETGVRIDKESVRYLASQPWPFPQSCMLAFTATADDTATISIDEKEIVEAGWFGRDDIVAACQVAGATMRHEVAEAALKNNPLLKLLIPPKGVIARKLVDEWVAQGS